MKLPKSSLIIALCIIGLIFLSKTIVDQNHIKHFNEIGKTLAQSVNQLAKEPGIAGTGFAGNADKNLFKVLAGIDHTKISNDKYMELVESYLNSGVSLEPYTLQIETFNNDKSTGSTIIAVKPPGSSKIHWMPDNIP